MSQAKPAKPQRMLGEAELQQLVDLHIECLAVLGLVDGMGFEEKSHTENIEVVDHKRSRKC